MRIFYLVLLALLCCNNPAGAEGVEESREHSDLYFREDFREIPEQVPVTQDHIKNEELLVARFGPAAEFIKKSHHDNILNDPWYVWSGLCQKGRWAIALRKKGALVNLAKGGRIRWRTKQTGKHILKVILELEDGTWLVSERGFGETPDWHVFTMDFEHLGKQKNGLRWHKLDIDSIVAKQWVKNPDLSRVRSIGWTDLDVGKVSKGCTRVDWIEVYGKPVRK